MDFDDGDNDEEAEYNEYDSVDDDKVRRATRAPPSFYFLRCVAPRLTLSSAVTLLVKMPLLLIPSSCRSHQGTT